MATRMPIANRAAMRRELTFLIGVEARARQLYDGYVPEMERAEVRGQMQQFRREVQGHHNRAERVLVALGGKVEEPGPVVKLTQPGELLTRGSARRLGQLRVLQELMTLALLGEATWATLEQVAEATGDEDLGAAARSVLREKRAQLRWFQRKIEDLGVWAMAEGAL